jgi:hypothetical protein
MWRSEGPSGSLWRAMEMGTEGLRYFMRGSISRQKALEVSVSGLVVCLDDVRDVAFRGMGGGGW